MSLMRNQPIIIIIIIITEIFRVMGNATTRTTIVRVSTAESESAVTAAE